MANNRKPPSSEAKSIPYSLNEVLFEELTILRPNDVERIVPIKNVSEGATPHEWDENATQRSSNLKDIFDRIGQLSARGEAADGPLTALCLSGGGVRSATFGLGILQGLAKLGLLGKFDYVSSVSGGGYIAGWLHAWIHRTSVSDVEQSLALSAAQRNENPLAPEPKPVDLLREFSNYLTPKVGLLSLDTWMLAAIVLRNVLLNWLVIIPILVAAIWVPQAMPYVLSDKLQASTVAVLLALAALMALITSINVHAYRRRLFSLSARPLIVVCATVVPLYLSAVLLAWAAAMTESRWTVSEALSDPLAWTLTITWALVLPLVGWMWHEPAWRSRNQARAPWYELLGMLVSGGVASVVLLVLLGWLPHWLPDHKERFVVLALPALLATYLVARMVFVAFASLEKASPSDPAGGLEDHDREWWARYSAWILYFAAGWAMVAGLCLYGPMLIVDSRFSTWLTTAVASLGGLSGLAIRLLGTASKTPGTSSSRASSPVQQYALAFAAPLFCVCVIVLLGLGVSQLMASNYSFSVDRQAGLATLFADLLLLIAPLLVLVVTSWLFGFVVNANYFSLHAMYRNRLVRAYLGASNPSRIADQFTGFATDDDLPLHVLRPGNDQGANRATHPLAVINVALNLVTTTTKLAWQQRKAESFSMTPLFCGNFHEGYRRTTEYGGAEGISLGTAAAVSGAAASPNMGYHSSPAIAFLLTLFNGRLGVWLGNTNEHGANTFRRDGPRSSVLPLLRELIGMSTSKSSYINLSDGGHFENLGLYEMVLRRCRYIVVCDGSCDPRASFEDLGNAIRKIRIDFGISIVFDPGIDILARESATAGIYWAVGAIHYKDADGPAAPDGILVYVKPAFYGRSSVASYDVYSYAIDKVEFPHETTSDQWFDESQFESYRALGQHVVGRIATGHSISSVAGFARAAVENSSLASVNDASAGLAPPVGLEPTTR